jgi:hypothetical protein
LSEVIEIFDLIFIQPLAFFWMLFSMLVQSVIYFQQLSLSFVGAPMILSSLQIQRRAQPGSRKKLLDVSNVQINVFDEADLMIDHDINQRKECLVE